MTSIRTWAKRAFVGGLAPVAVYGSRFAGNIILSRLLAPEEFGTAVAISVVLGLGGLATDVALDRFVMFDGSSRALSTAHLVAALNGIFLTTVLFLAAPFTAGLFGVPNFSGSFAAAAGISVLGALAHLGVKQIQRNYKYGPDAVAQVTANLIGILALLIAAKVLRDHRAIIVGMALQTAIYVVLSHVLSPTSYNMRCDKEMLFRALSFGLPLTLNGIGLAAVSQLDRVLVGSWFGVKELGLYAVMFSMSVVPTNLLIGVFSGPSFSFLLENHEDTASRGPRYQLLLAFYSVLAGLYACWIAVTLDVLTPLIFGPAFAISKSAHILFILIACFRLQRSGAPTALLLASGKTKQLAFLNLSAGCGLVVASALVSVWPSLEAVLLGITIGEFASLAICLMSQGNSIRPLGLGLIDVVRVSAVPAFMAAALAWHSSADWGTRGMLLVMGAGFVIIQLSIEIYITDRLRSVLAQSPVGRRIKMIFPNRFCTD